MYKGVSRGSCGVSLRQYLLMDGDMSPSSYLFGLMCPSSAAYRLLYEVKSQWVLTYKQDVSFLEGEFIQTNTSEWPPLCPCPQGEPQPPYASPGDPQA